MKYPVIDPKGTGRQLKHLLTEKKMSIRDVSASLGLSSVQAVYKWLRGDSIPSVDNLLAISTMLETPIDHILVKK